MDRSPTEYGGPGRLLPTLATSSNAVRIATHGDGRDTLFSYYDCSQPLFGKAAEAAIILHFIF